MTHDPLCPESGRDYGECFSQNFSDAFCLCDIIVKVRADERSRWAPPWMSEDYARGYRQGQDDQNL